MESKYDQEECCGFCALDVCNNENCPKWQEMVDRDTAEALWMLLSDDVNY